MINNLFSVFKNDLKCEDCIIERKKDTRNNNFLESIKVDVNPLIINLVSKIKSREMRIEDLSDTQLDQMISYYRNKLNKK